MRTELVARTDETTGTALIWITEGGENSIIVAPGANSRVAVAENASERLAEADVVIAQLEIPLRTVLAAARARRKARLPKIMNTHRPKVGP